MGTVSDASTGNLISGANASYGGNSTTTALRLPNNSWPIKNVMAAGPQPGYYNLNFEYDSSVNSYSVTASAPGYQNQTKTVTANINGGCNFATTANFSLTKTSSTSSSSNTSTSDSTTTTSKPSVSTSTFRSIKLPSIFTAKGSKTTDLSKIKDPKKIKDFTLHISGKNKIVFKDTLDLSGESTVEALKKLDKYVRMSTTGKIELDSKSFPALNKKATLTMEKLKHVSTPEILVDGKKDTKTVVSNAAFDKDKETLTFDVAHFTVFEAVPKLELTSPLETISEQNTSVVGQISDPVATVTGRFNEVDLAPIKIDEETGRFTITTLSFKEGENFLTLEATSKLGKVLPVVATIVYDPSGAATTISPSRSNTQMAIMGVILMGALAFLIILGYLVYRKRKHHKPDAPKSTFQIKLPKIPHFR